MKKSIFYLSLAVIAVSCAKEINPGASEQNLAPMQFEISVEATKTALASDGKSVAWIEGDKVAIFDDGDSAKEFTVQSSGVGSTLSGSADPESSEYYAVYPYDGADKSDNVFTSSIASQQIVTAGSMADDCAVLIAKAEDDKLYFKNVTALVKFTLDVEGVRSLTLIGNNKEQIAGKFSIDWNNGDPVVSSTSPEVTVTLRDASSADGNEAADLDLAKGDYYFTILPVKFEKGFSVILGMNDGTQKIVNRSSGLELDRNEIFRTQAVPASAYKAHASNFVKYNDGFDLVYGSETVNISDTNLKYATYVNDGRPDIKSSGVFFVAPQAQDVTMAINTIYRHVVAGDNPSYRSSVQVTKSLQLQQITSAFSVLADLNIESAVSLFGQGVTKSRSIVIKNCKVVSTARYPLIQMSSEAFALVNLDVEDSDILLDNSGSSAPNFIYFGASGKTQTVTNINIKNNVFQNINSEKTWTNSRIIWGTSLTATDVTFTNNTLVGMLHTPVISNNVVSSGILQAKKYAGTVTVKNNFFIDCQNPSESPYLVHAGTYAEDCKINMSGNLCYTEGMTAVPSNGSMASTVGGTRYSPRAFTKYPLSDDWNPLEGVFGYQSDLKYYNRTIGDNTDTNLMKVSNTAGAQRKTVADTADSGYGDNNNGSL